MKLESVHEYELALAELRRLTKDLLDDAQSPRRAWALHVSGAIAEYVLAESKPFTAATTEGWPGRDPHGPPSDVDWRSILVGKGMAAQATVNRFVEDDTAPVRGPYVVHHLRHGLSACPVSAAFGMPRYWPPAHRWSAEWQDVNCAACLEKKP